MSWGAVAMGVGSAVGGYFSSKGKGGGMEVGAINPYLDDQSQEMYREKQRELGSYSSRVKNRAEDVGQDISRFRTWDDLANIADEYRGGTRSASRYPTQARGDVEYAGSQAGKYMKNIGKAYDPVIRGYQKAAQSQNITAAQNLNKQTLAGAYLNSPQDQAYANSLIQRASSDAADAAARIKSRNAMTGTGRSTMNDLAMMNAGTLARSKGTQQAADYTAARYAAERGLMDNAVARTPGLEAAQADLYSKAAGAETARVGAIQGAGVAQSNLYAQQSMNELQALLSGYGLESQMAMNPLQAKLLQAGGEMGIYGQAMSPYNTLASYLKLGRADDTYGKDNQSASGSDWMSALAQVGGSAASAYFGGGGGF